MALRRKIVVETEFDLNDRGFGLSHRPPWKETPVNVPPYLVFSDGKYKLTSVRRLSGGCLMDGGYAGPVELTYRQRQ